MNFITFPVGATNIFPIANSSAGGQLVTEFNLRSRESVAVGPLNSTDSISYITGPSYTHAEGDFAVSVQTDGAGTTISTSTIEIAPGRCVLNGHYVECLTSMTIDMLAANVEAKTSGASPLKGHLCIGLRAMYSTLPTLAGSILVENKDMMYNGVQVVILPVSQFKLPSDVPKTPNAVTAHLKLAEFYFVNGTIASITDNYPARCQSLSAGRIADVDQLLSDIYITKSGLNPKKLYVFAGKGSNTAIDGRDTWCDATDSMMVWDSAPQLTTSVPIADSASFAVNTNGKVQLYLPHKQVDGMTNTAGQAQYYAAKLLDLPLASFSQGTSGTVNKAYTDAVKSVLARIRELKLTASGKQIGYIAVLSDITELPSINSAWDIGDYILVCEDTTLDSSSDSVRAPSTMYAVLPGVVSRIKYLGTTPPAGVELARLEMTTAPNTTVADTYNTYWDWSSSYRGTKNVDYFTVVYDSGNVTTCYYYTPSETGDRAYSAPIWVTGEIPYAQETTIGGFKNVPDTALDAGYVYRDENGYLRLLDYTLLRSGTLAYQLGQNFTVAAGSTTSDIQAQLDEYVNNRIAFPNTTQQSETNPEVIHITIDLSAETSATTLNICNIDSRFGTSVYLHITGSADSNTTINIANVEKLRIDNSIGGTPIINVANSRLFYDAAVLDSLTTIVELSLWYVQYNITDPELIVDDMTVQEVGTPVITESSDYWSSATPNDNHFTYALHSITFSKSGNIIGGTLYMRNETTSNVQLGTTISVASFVLPQGTGLNYPKSRLTKQLKITGNFITAYGVDTGFMAINTTFTAVSQAYNEYDLTTYATGTISFFMSATVVTNLIGITSSESIDGWESNSFHLFSGGAIG